MTRLAIVFLRGGADGLSILSPTGDVDYRRLRPTQALESAAVHRLDATFGLHPAATRMATLADAGTLAVVPACGFEGQSRSHFAAQAALESGATGAATGWVGRHLDATTGKTPSPFRAVAVGTISLPPTLRGTTDALGAPSLASLQLGALRPTAKRKAAAARPEPFQEQFDPAGLLAGWSSSGSKVATAGVNAAVTVLDQLGSPSRAQRNDSEASGATPTTAPGTAPPMSSAASDASRDMTPAVADQFGDGEVAEVFAAGSAVLDAELGTEVLMLDIGGWDTHNAQGTTDGQLNDLIGGIDKGLGTLMDLHDDLTVVVMTEFGRRVAENSSGGFDHGKGSLVIVAGKGVNGGVHGQWPGLARLDDGDVPAANDIRAIQAEIAETVLRTPNVERVVPGAGQRLGLLT